MAGETSLSFRVDRKTADAVDELATATDRPRSWHLEQALTAYLDVQAWQVEKTRKGMADHEAKRTVAHKDVASWLSTWGAPDESKPPE